MKIKTFHDVVVITLAVIAGVILAAVVLCADSFSFNQLPYVSAISGICFMYLFLFIMANTPDREE